MKIYWSAILLMLTAGPAYAATSVSIEDLTWPEVRERMQAGATTILIPSGGTEQNGPHIVIGKHNRIVAHTSHAIARELKNAMVAPVIAYVPEGDIDSNGHMQFPGTISLRENTFAALLEDAARSFKRHGFKLICFIGDSGGNQKAQQDVAEKLSREWKADGVKVLNVSDYYEDKNGIAWAKRRSKSDPSAHGGFMDTSEAMVAQDGSVREAQIIAYTEQDFERHGVNGNPTGASRDAGHKLLEFKIRSAVSQIRAAQARQ